MIQLDLPHINPLTITLSYYPTFQCLHRCHHKEYKKVNEIGDNNVMKYYRHRTQNSMYMQLFAASERMNDNQMSLSRTGLYSNI